jgi:hypothetical protein
MRICRCSRSIGRICAKRKRSAPSPEYAVSNGAATYIADAMMEIALQFEATHFAQIRRHYQSTTPKRDDDLGNSICSANIAPSDATASIGIHKWPKPFFGSIRAASILPSRPPNLAAAARRAYQGRPRLRSHPQGLGLDWPGHGGMLIESGLQALDTLRKFKLVALLQIHTAGDIMRRDRHGRLAIRSLRRKNGVSKKR